MLKTLRATSVLLALLLVIGTVKCSDKSGDGDDLGCESRTNREALCNRACLSDDDCGDKENCVCDGDCGASCVKEGTQCNRVPKVRNSKKKVSGRNFGDTITYTCKKSYTMFGKDTITCRGIGEWDRELPRCVVACPDPGLQEYTRRDTPPRQRHFPVGTELEYWCLPGFQVVEGNITIKCQEDGQWSGTPPKCAMKSCLAPEAPSNGKLNPVKDSYELGEKVYVSCDSGFRRIGLRMRRCGINGWTKGEIICEGKSCGDPGRPNHGQRIGLNFQFKSVVRFQCDSGYELVGPSFVTCLSNQRWSSTKLPTCQSIRCPTPVPKGGVEVEVHGTSVGEKVKVKCKEGLMLRGPEERVCQANGTWSGEEPKCTEFVCPRPEFQGLVDPERLEYPIDSQVRFTCRGEGKLVGARSATCIRTRTSAVWDQKIPVCYECNSNPIGFESGKIKKSQLSQGEVKVRYSVAYKPDPDKARLHGSEAWCAYKLVKGYLQVDLLATFLINGIATQGGAREYEWVEYYLLQYSTNGFDWFTYQEKGENKVLVGNVDRNTVKKNVFQNSVRARYVRIIPLTLLGKDYGCLRMELYGCIDPKECIGEGSAVWFREDKRKYLKGTISEIGEDTVSITHPYTKKFPSPYTMKKDVHLGMFADDILPIDKVKNGDDVITMWKYRPWYYLGKIRDKNVARAYIVQTDGDNAWTLPADFRARKIHELHFCERFKRVE